MPSEICNLAKLNYYWASEMSSTVVQGQYVLEYDTIDRHERNSIAVIFILYISVDHQVVMIWLEC